MLNIAAVSYLNTRPFLDGLTLALPERSYQLKLGVPSECVRLYQRGVVDLALIPVAALPTLDNSEILPGFCIGAEGCVDSVFLFSDVPVNEITGVVLDADSRTSNALIQVLFRYLWKRTVNFFPAKTPLKPNYGLVSIGDKAVLQKDRFRFRYDLAEGWQQAFNLPFVFAVWVYRPQKVTIQQLSDFQNALGVGLAQKQTSAQRWADHYDVTPERAAFYLQSCISYRFDEAKKRALDKFLGLIKQLPPLFSPVFVQNLDTNKD